MQWGRVVLVVKSVFRKARGVAPCGLAPASEFAGDLVAVFEFLMEIRFMSRS